MNSTASTLSSHCFAIVSPSDVCVCVCVCVCVYECMSVCVRLYVLTWPYHFPTPIVHDQLQGEISGVWSEDIVEEFETAIRDFQASKQGGAWKSAAPPV